MATTDAAAMRQLPRDFDRRHVYIAFQPKDYSLLQSVQKQSVIVYLNQTTPIFLNLTEFIEKKYFL
jgi:hypothetical protein